jgi:5'-nucleotidase
MHGFCAYRTRRRRTRTQDALEDDVVDRNAARRSLLVRATLPLLLLAAPIAPLGSAASAQTLSSASRAEAAEPSATLAKGRLLAINDFHGALDPPTGSGGLVNGVPAGGAEYLAFHIKRMRAEAEAAGETVLTAAAGDLVGSSPLLSAAFHDEPTIEVLSALGLDVSSVGHDEFAEGVTELRRLQLGGCHPVDGCQDGDGFAGARFRYLAANVVDRRTRLPILLPVDVRFIQGVPVGIVGVTLRSTPAHVHPAGVQTVDFLDEAQTANFYASVLRLAGIRAMVLLIHEGGRQNPPPANPEPSGCTNFSGPIAGIVARLRPEFGVVISGHTHESYACALPNASGNRSVVTSAGANGTLITTIGMTLDKRTRQFVSVAGANVIVENGIRLPDGTWMRDGDGNFVRNHTLSDPETKALVDTYRAAVAPIANQIVGSITADITRLANPAGESSLGDVVADAQLAHSSTTAGAAIALVAPGALRDDLRYALSPGGEAPGQVTYGEAFAVQPLNNIIVTQSLTGAQIKGVLEQQFAGVAGQTAQRIPQVSNGFTYSYETSGPLDNRVSNLALNGLPINPAATYRVTTDAFLAGGGDGFSRLGAGTDRTTHPGFDVDALAAYLGTGPVAPGPVNRITRLN